MSRHHSRATAFYSGYCSITARRDNNARPSGRKAKGPSVDEIIAGVRKFQREVYPRQWKLFERLATGQSPDALIITCSDSRVDPHLLTQSEPGTLFELRNAGNLVPPYGRHVGGVTATIEFAVVALRVPNIIICGHSGCGAMAGLLDPAQLRGMPQRRRMAQARRDRPRIARVRRSIRRPRRPWASGRGERDRPVGSPANASLGGRRPAFQSPQAARLGLSHCLRRSDNLRRRAKAIHAVVTAGQLCGDAARPTRFTFHRG